MVEYASDHERVFLNARGYQIFAMPTGMDEPWPDRICGARDVKVGARRMSCSARVCSAGNGYYSRALNSSIVRPACLMIPRTVPRFSVLPACPETVVARRGSSLWTSRWWLPDVRTIEKSAR
jgi:hypothetical protein